jgi:3-hydroxybutyryl-CoA dehydrogenase
MATVGVVGAGVMGTGVAHDAAQCGHEVILMDRSPEAVDCALAQIRRDCRMQRLITGSSADPSAVLARIRTTADLADLAECEFVVANVTERWEIKRPVYEALGRICQTSAIFIANTSAIPITRLASVSSRPEQVIGVHFMNPVPLKRSVELIPGRHTSPETQARVVAFLESLAKAPILVNDACGFVSNRVLMLTVNEAAFLVYEGVANAATVDEVFRSCFGHPMGPLETADLIGVDTILDSVEVLHEHFADSKYRPCPLLREMVAAGFRGRKVGRGFFTYDAMGNHRLSQSESASSFVPETT